MDTLANIFSALCGQEPGHTWAPGGLLLPCCQRCAGLYAGALAAGVLHLFFRPRLSGRFLEVHGLFLLLMVPFGYHWLPQGPALRAITGVLFGFGIVTMLRLPLESPGWVGRGEGIARSPMRWAAGWYFAGVAASLMLVPWLGSSGSELAAWLLTGATAGGLSTFFLLLAADAAVAARAAGRALRRLFGNRADA